MDTDIPINVIVLSDQEDEMECMIQSCLDILKTCTKRSEKEALIRMVAQDAREITLREVLTKQIQNFAKVLDDTKKY